MIGQTVSHFKIIEKLGEGGMGVVYKAQDLKLNRPVALKFLPPHLTNDERTKKRFIHEAQAASALDHVNVCTVYEVGETNEGRLFIAMACYEGESLQERIARGPVPATESVDIARQIADGLAKAHTNEIVHRDIKPANIFITTDGVVKIVDFGLAKLAGQTRMTRTGTTVGTVAYMSPEQGRGEELDHRADIWSLGVTLFEMITGRLPFRGDHEQAMVYSILNEEPASVSTLCPDVPRQVEEIIVRALEKRPEERFPDASTLVKVLDEVRELLDTESQQRRGRRVLSRRARRRRRWMTAGVAGAIVIAALIIVQRFAIKDAAGAPAIAVVPLTKSAGDDDVEQTTRMIARMLTTDLGESNHIRVLGSAALQQVLMNRRLRATSECTLKDFKDIARSANLSHIVTLSFFRGGTTLRTDIEILDMSDGHAVATASEEANGDDNLVKMIDPLAKKTREALLSKNQLASENDRPFGDITSNSPEAVALYYQAQEYDQQSNAARAIALYDRVLQLDPNFYLARLSRDLSVEGNVASVEAGNRDQLSTFEQLLLEAYGAFSKGDFPTMLQKANQMLALRPSNWDGINLKYTSEYFLGRYAETVETCERAVNSGYRSYYDHLFLNSGYAMSGLDAMEISERYTALLKQDPSDAMMKFWLAVTYLLLDMNVEAKDLLDSVFEVYPDNDAFMRVLTDTYTWREGPDKAADYEAAFAYIDRMRKIKITYEGSAGLPPDDTVDYDWLLRGVPISFRIGELYFLQGKLDQAIAAYERSLNLKEDYYNSFYRLGLAYEQGGQVDKAITNFERYIGVTELNAYDASALGREASCAATRACHAISRPVALADAKHRVEQLR